MKKIISLLLICFICINFMCPSKAIEIYSNYAYAADVETGLVYLDVKSEQKIYPASMTKIVTLMCALDKIDDINKKVDIKYEDLDGLYEANASVCGFSVNEIVTVEDLLYGVLLPSGADACNALARITYGNTDLLVEAMNKKVEELNLKGTHFANVTGLHDDDHYTTCYDMSKLLEEALKNVSFKKIFETREYTSSSKEYTWYSSLKKGEMALNRDTTCINGGKSGFTYEARLAYASSMTIDGHNLICVVADADYNISNSHVNDTLDIYHNINDHYHNVNIFNNGDILKTFKIFKTKYSQYNYTIDKNINLLLDKNISRDDLDIQIYIDEKITAPVTQGSKIGELTIKHNDITYVQYDLLLNETIDKDFIGLTLYYAPYIISGVSLIALIIIVFKVKKNMA